MDGSQVNYSARRISSHGWSFSCNGRPRDIRQHCSQFYPVHSRVPAWKSALTYFSVPNSHHSRELHTSHRHTAFLFLWLLYLKPPGHPLEIPHFLEECGYSSFCGTGVLQGLLQLCCVELFRALSGRTPFPSFSLSSRFIKS